MAIADKFYTKQEVADKCVERLLSLVNTNNKVFLEPTAGNGMFLNSLKGKQFEAYDILPEDERIVKKNIFDFRPTNHNYITIGNPPFGKRSKLAIDVFNAVSDYSDVVAFILPVSFMKYGVQKLLNPKFKLIDYFFLLPYSFTDREKEYDVNCVFQIWSKDGEKDLRIKEAPPISYPDFNLWQYNATPEAFNCVNENWDIALYRQGYKNYNKIFYQKDKEEIISQMKNNIQFFFIQILNKEAKSTISKMDFNNLAARNTATPGFGKVDFISYYLETKNKNNKKL